MRLGDLGAPPEISPESLECPIGVSAVGPSQWADALRLGCPTCRALFDPGSPNRYKSAMLSPPLQALTIASLFAVVGAIWRYERLKPKVPPGTCAVCGDPAPLTDIFCEDCRDCNSW